MKIFFLFICFSVGCLSVIAEVESAKLLEKEGYFAGQDIFKMMGMRPDMRAEMATLYPGYQDFMGPNAVSKQNRFIFEYTRASDSTATITVTRESGIWPTCAERMDLIEEFLLGALQYLPEGTWKGALNLRAGSLLYTAQDIQFLQGDLAKKIFVRQLPAMDFHQDTTTATFNHIVGGEAAVVRQANYLIFGVVSQYGFPGELQLAWAPVNSLRYLHEKGGEGWKWNGLGELKSAFSLKGIDGAGYFIDQDKRLAIDGEEELHALLHGRSVSGGYVMSGGWRATMNDILRFIPHSWQMSEVLKTHVDDSQFCAPHRNVFTIQIVSPQMFDEGDRWLYYRLQ